MILWSNSIEDAMFFSLHPSSQCIIWISLLLMIFYFGHLIKVLSPSLSHYKETLQLISIWHYATILSLIKVLNLFTNNTFISWTHVFLCNWIGYNIFYCYFFFDAKIVPLQVAFSCPLNMLPVFLEHFLTIWHKISANNLVLPLFQTWN